MICHSDGRFPSPVPDSVPNPSARKPARQLGFAKPGDVGTLGTRKFDTLYRRFLENRLREKFLARARKCKNLRPHRPQ